MLITAMLWDDECNKRTIGLLVRRWYHQPSTVMSVIRNGIYAFKSSILNNHLHRQLYIYGYAVEGYEGSPSGARQVQCWAGVPRGQHCTRWDSRGGERQARGGVTFDHRAPSLSRFLLHPRIQVSRNHR